MRRSLIVLLSMILLSALLCGGIVLFTPLPSREGIGNQVEALSKIASGPADFTAAILGDSQKGITGTKRLQESVSGVDFALHCGDMVSNNDEGHWRLFLSSVRIRPLAACPGNHDVKGGRETFERIFGSTTASFSRGSCRFILLDVPSVERFPFEDLERELKNTSEPDRIVLFHVPPFDYEHGEGAPRAGWERFFELIEKYGVRYVFTGHHHDYVRREHRGTIFITNGIGGDFESWSLKTQPHLTLLHSRNGRLSDERISVEPAHGLWDNAEHFAIGHFGEVFRRHPFPSGALLLGILLLEIWILRRRW